MLSRKSHASAVHPGVLSRGYINKTTRLPRKSESRTAFPSSSCKAKSGAGCPAWTFCSADVPNVYHLDWFTKMCVSLYKYAAKRVLCQSKVLACHITLLGNEFHIDLT